MTTNSNPILYLTSPGDGTYTLHRLSGNPGGDVKMEYVDMEGDMGQCVLMIPSTLNDNGNGVTIIMNGVTKFDLDYGEVEDIRHLLDYYAHHSPSNRYTPTVKKLKELTDDE